jgi:tRNA G18 (ribose-2'-O)-methylase SpoU
MESLLSAADPRADPYRATRDADLIRARNLFVAEGRMVVRRVLEDRRYRLHSVLLTPAAHADLAPALASIDSQVPVLVAAQPDLSAIAGYDVHRGCLALVHIPQPPALDELLARATTLVVMEAVTNADNVGGVFRNAAAFGAGGVLLSPTCCDPFYRKAIRTSMAAVLRVPFARAGEREWPDVLTQIRRAGFAIVALTPREPSEALDAFAARQRPAKLALVVGTEGAGLTPGVEGAADYRVRIPIGSEVDSLNVAVAAGIALYELSKNRT